MRRKTPQQKKAESYAYDRRSLYGNNDKAARKALPRRRQKRAQAERRIAKQELAGRAAAEDEVRLDTMLDRVAQTRRKAWRKSPDQLRRVMLAWKGKLPDE
ncbi:MAG TPA: hypothetical protein VFH27_14195 [Longimicrobiaceae bacterium]|nr:hypothetical protein [Longimicrobiaceae bacterium]